MSSAEDATLMIITSHELAIGITHRFCMKTKSLFDDLEVEYSVMELNEREDGAAVQAALAELTGQRTVPNVFVKGKHIGGNDDTQKANRDGYLLKMLE